jgi:hypothetical protein
MAGFDALRRELDLWAEAGRPATLWWRDDDAVAVTDDLRRLRALSEGAEAPVGLAVIPTLAEPSLGGWLAGWREAAVLQHGISHADHAAPGERKVELGGTRDPADAVGDLVAAFRAMGPPSPLPFLVPPWNRIAPGVVDRLAAAGYRGLSAFGPRPAALRAGLVVVNCHVDLMLSRGRGFLGEDAAVAALCGHLEARRRGAVDPGEPTGILTHHRVHDAECWRFLDGLLDLCARHPAVRWASPRDFLAAGDREAA